MRITETETTWVLAPVTLRDSVDLAIVDQFGLPTVSAATARWLRYAVERFVRYLGEDRAVDRVTPQAVAAWVDYEANRITRYGAPPAATSVNSQLRAIKTLYSRLQLAGVAGANPAAPVRFLPEPPLLPGAVAEADYLAMRAAAGHSRDRAILDVLWASGCRLGGLLSMRIDQMQHWHDSHARFALQVVEKGGKRRYVYVGREPLQAEGLAAWLADRPATAGPWLWLSFAAPFGRMAPSTVEGVLRRLRLAAEIPDGRPCNAHAFRHAFAVRMLDDGDDLAAVSAWLGHYAPEFTAAVYARRSEEQLREKFFHKR